ncbi:hypothetical protein [Nonomuraea pusilla]|uniref:Uncharacterized protein n=1 Tax=Nonomuraea pusilla TaxID=46177 RepID=A0A1H7TBX1_9ACTN|nr:hypothetical protein [Nonomuraea pusilla]SEL82009.1 hypothetical protein SAMN05660976_03420 [Nonomuraea pusilla]
MVAVLSVIACLVIVLVLCVLALLLVSVAVLAAFGLLAASTADWRAVRARLHRLRTSARRDPPPQPSSQPSSQPPETPATDLPASSAPQPSRGRPEPPGGRPGRSDVTPSPSRGTPVPLRKDAALPGRAGRLSPRGDGRGIALPRRGIGLPARPAALHGGVPGEAGGGLPGKGSRLLEIAVRGSRRGPGSSGRVPAVVRRFRLGEARRARPDGRPRPQEPAPPDRHPQGNPT